jgi:hypothetical protein
MKMLASTDPRTLRADRAVRVHVARDEGSSRGTIVLGLLAAAALWAAILIPAVLSAGS